MLPLGFYLYVWSWTIQADGKAVTYSRQFAIVLIVWTSSHSCSSWTDRSLVMLHQNGNPSSISFTHSIATLSRSTDRLQSVSLCAQPNRHGSANPSTRIIIFFTPNLLSVSSSHSNQFILTRSKYICLFLLQWIGLVSIDLSQSNDNDNREYQSSCVSRRTANWTHFLQ